MLIPVLINGGLAAIWGYIYYVTGSPYILFSSGIGVGAAIVCLIDYIVTERMWL